MDAGRTDLSDADERRHCALAASGPDVEILVLNYDGLRLLNECLPSIVRAATESSRNCRVTVVDNSSPDDPTTWLAAEFPTVDVRRLPNQGLVSFNTIVGELTSRVVVLLNNDIKLAPDAIDPLVAPLFDDDGGGEPVFMTAPRCTLFDGVTHEGFKTAVMFRRGLVQATALFGGAEQVVAMPSATASAGAALAVDRRKFLSLGGFDPLYLPGRIEDLDLAFRGFVAGFRAVYVPEALALHKGNASFGPAFGSAGNDHLALRNTLLFQWKNLHELKHRAAYLAWLPLRALRDLLTASKTDSNDRFPFLRAYAAALAVWRERAGNVRFQPARDASTRARESEYFTRHSPRRLLAVGESAVSDERERSLAAEESRRAVNYPLARWYSRPAAAWFASAIADTCLRPWHLTLVGFICACVAATCLLAAPGSGAFAAGLLLMAWFFDRADGLLARRQARATPLGAWLDANVDEAIDLGLHICIAVAAAAATQTNWPWICLVAFLFGKYLLMYGLAAGETLFDNVSPTDEDSAAEGAPRSLLKRLYHLPGNADVRIHVTALALASGYLTTELVFVACYYNFRWPARIALQIRRASARRTLRRLA